MKTKIIIALSTLWVLLSALTEVGLIDALPIENEAIKQWVKWIIAALLVVVNMFYVKPEIAKKMITNAKL